MQKNCKWKVKGGAVFRAKMPARKGTVATNLENYQGGAFLCPGHLKLVDEAPTFTNHALYKTLLRERYVSFALNQQSKCTETDHTFLVLLTRGYARAYHELLQGDKDMQMSHSLTRSRRFRN